jgi:hypothetical protein
MVFNALAPHISSLFFSALSDESQFDILILLRIVRPKSLSGPNVVAKA